MKLIFSHSPRFPCLASSSTSSLGLVLILPICGHSSGLFRPFIHTRQDRGLSVDGGGRTGCRAAPLLAVVAWMVVGCLIERANWFWDELLHSIKVFHSCWLGLRSGCDVTLCQSDPRAPNKAVIINYVGSSLWEIEGSLVASFRVSHVGRS